MKILIDTCIWSAVLRKSTYNKNNPVINELKELILEGRVQMIGPIRQELLSGIKSQSQYNKLRKYLNSFPDLSIQTKDYEKAADIYNQNHRNGVQGSNTDFLICAISLAYKMPIFTVDKDFALFKKHIPIKLHIPEQ
jgi:predicted nucleic acid-binding protein